MDLYLSLQIEIIKVKNCIEVNKIHSYIKVKVGQFNDKDLLNWLDWVKNATDQLLSICFVEWVMHNLLSNNLITHWFFNLPLWFNIFDFVRFWRVSEFEKKHMSSVNVNSLLHCSSVVSTGLSPHPLETIAQ